MLYGWYLWVVDEVEEWAGGKEWWGRALKLGFRLLLLFAGIWTICPVLVGETSKSSISKIQESYFKSKLQAKLKPPDIIFCLPANTRMEYKVWYNLSTTTNITENELNVMASAAMNGSTEASRRLATEKGYTSDTALWEAMTIKKEDFLTNPRKSSGCAKKCSGKRDSGFCERCSKDLFLGWIWVKPLKSRCIVLNMKRFSGSFVTFKANKKWNRFYSHKIGERGKVSAWMGNLDFERVTDLYQPSWIGVNGIVFVKGKPRKIVCHPELGLDFGEPFVKCSENRGSQSDYILWNIAKGPESKEPGKLMNIDAGSARFSFGLFRMDEILSVDYAKEFTNTIKLELGLGVADSFAGVTFVVILVWLAQKEEGFPNKKYSLLLKIFRGILITFLFACYLWFASHTVWNYFTHLYATSYTIGSRGEDLPFPRLQICSDHGSNRWFNRSKLLEYGVSSHLFQYMTIVGQMSYPYAYADPSLLKYTLEPDGEEENYRNLFAFQNLSDFEATAETMNSEFQKLSAKIGISKKEAPYKVVNYFLQDPSKWVLSCKINGIPLSDCASLFKAYKDKRLGDVCWEFNQTHHQGTRGKVFEFQFASEELASEDSDFNDPYFGSEEKFLNASGKYSLKNPPVISFRAAGNMLYSLRNRYDFHSKIEVAFRGMIVETKLRNCVADQVCPDIPLFDLANLYFLRFVQKNCGCSLCQQFPTGSVPEFQSKCCSADQAFRCLARPEYHCDVKDCSSYKSMTNPLLESIDFGPKCMNAIFFDPFYPFAGVLQKKSLECPQKCQTIQYRKPTVTFTRLEADQSSESEKKITKIHISIASDVFVEEFTEVYTFRVYELVAILFSCGGALLGLSLLRMLEYSAKKLTTLASYVSKSKKIGQVHIGKSLSVSYNESSQKKTKEPPLAEKEVGDQISIVKNVLFSLYLLCTLAAFILIAYSLISEIKEQPFSVENKFDEATYPPPATAFCVLNGTQKESLAKIFNTGATCNNVSCGEIFTIFYERDGVYCLISNQWRSGILASQFKILTVKLARGFKWGVGWKKGLVLEYSAVKRSVQPKFLLKCTSRKDLTIECPPCPEKNETSWKGHGPGICSSDGKMRSVPFMEEGDGIVPCSETEYNVAPREQETSTTRDILLIHILHTHSMVKSIAQSERFDIFNIISFCLSYIGILVGLNAFDILLIPVVILRHVFRKISAPGSVADKPGENIKGSD